MNLDDCSKILQEPIESNNKVLLFTFSFSTNFSGLVNAFDRQLEVNIQAKWELIQLENETLITIHGFDITKFGEAGLKCNIIELEK
jgi:hypothetical protein